MEGRRDPAGMKLRPIAGLAALTRARALRGVAVTTQSASGHAPTPGSDRRKQHAEKLPLWLTDGRHLLPSVADNCQRL